MSDQTKQMEEQPILLQRREVERRVGLSKSAIYDRIAKGTFPAPVKDLDTASVWWIESEVRNWIAERIQKRNMGTGMGSAKNGGEISAKSTACG